MTAPRRGLVGAALAGAVLSVWRYLPVAVGVFREMSARSTEIARILSSRDARVGPGPTARDRRRFRLGQLWCVTVFPAYQVADDLPGYWLYLTASARAGPWVAYAVTAAVALVLAAALGLVQRTIERHRADLLGLDAREDDSDNARYALDALVMSAPWQVYRRANLPGSGAHVGITPTRRVLQHSALYAAANTTLYVVGRYLPVGDWTGFVLALVAVTALGGAWVGASSARPGART